LLLRTWNVFHGNADPPERAAFLAEMLRLATGDRPDVLCLQELPVWSLSRLERWTGFRAAGAVAARPVIGPVPAPAELGRVVTNLHHGVLRSAFTGQANALLVAPDWKPVDHRVLTLNAGDFRRRETRRLRLGLVTRLAWAKERRVCQVLRLRRGTSTLLVANLHATSYPDKRLANAELHRAATYVDAFADRREPVVLAGDFNLTVRNSSCLRALATPEWAFEGASESGIDHVLVRGLSGTATTRWPTERRRLDGRVLSDHAPAERWVE
jgi:endonuclease/exonuclease/phosphatase family metal-dependent hydrolase